jgi:NAD(P)H-nitrite reductase large subunit
MSTQEEEVYICRCEEVTRERILAAIADGAATIKGIKLRTEAGMGLCQGRTCRRIISQMLAGNGVRPLADLYPPRIRAPVRTAKINEYINPEDDE